MTVQGRTVVVCPISPKSILTLLTATNTVIDGYTQPGAHPNTNGSGTADNTILTIDLDGTKLGPNGLGLLIKGSQNTVRGLALNNFGNTSGQAIEIDNFSTTPIVGNIVEGNFIGVGPNGTVPPGLGTITGIVLGSTTSNTRVGGTVPASVNVVNAIFDQGSGTGNVLEGNLVGTDPTGTKAILHAGGIGVAGLHLTIGGTTSSARNVISGNRTAGLQMLQPNLDVVQGNYIGTDITGTKALGNGQDGKAGISILLTRPHCYSRVTFCRTVLVFELVEGISPVNTTFSSTSLSGTDITLLNS